MVHALVAATALSLLAPEPPAQPQVPAGWSTLQDDRNDRFFFPHTGDRSTFVAFFPAQPIEGTLQQSLSSLWHTAIGSERIVDAQQRQSASPDGAPELLEIVATVDAEGQGVYRVFIIKQYGTRIVSGEFRSDDPAKMNTVGDAALRMLQGMTAAQ